MAMRTDEVRTAILGAGAAGLFCAAHAGPGVLVIDHAQAPGEKIRISGGGRCNFTNLRTAPGNFLSANPHFAKSALARYTPADFVSLVERHRIAWHEKTLGQLFCDGKATQIVAMLLAEAARAGAEVRLRTEIAAVAHDGNRFRLTLRSEGRDSVLVARNLVVATGGLSIPKMGASGLGYMIARQFGLGVVPTRPALVPFTFSDQPFADLAGVALPVAAMAGGARFEEAMLFTHRGLSGPAMLQISSFWHEGEAIAVDLLPGRDGVAALRAARAAAPKRTVAAALGALLPARLAGRLAPQGTLGQTGDAALAAVAAGLHRWELRPTATEGYRTAEVTLGGVDTAALSSATMMARAVPGLHFIGEVVDVTGWLGGYNFQWAWASAAAAGRAIAAAGQD